jgi:antitoxin Phd
MITKTSAEAQNQFGQLLDLVQREPVIITRHGRPTAFMYSPRDIEELVSIKQRRDQAAKDRDARRKQGMESSATAGFTEEDASQVAPKKRAPSRKRVRGSR